MSDLNLEEEIASALGKAVAEEMDFAVLASMLGWQQVDVFYHTMSEVDLWLEKNCKFKYKRYASHFMFEDENDANWFKLRWL